MEPVAELDGNLKKPNHPQTPAPTPTAEITTFEYDEYNKLTGITNPDSTTETMTYDDNGQLIRREISTGEVTTYEWNDQGMLVKVILPNGEPVKYFYDGDNRLVGRKSSEGYNEFVQSGWDIVEETDETGRRTYFTGLSAVKEESNIGTEYFHYNHRGDTVLKTDKDGNVLWDMSYEAYGKPTDSTGIPANEISQGEFPFLYNSEFGIRYDRKTKLHYMRNRWYSGGQMRFISSDLLMDLNRYGYVEGNPVTRIDPSGLAPSRPTGPEGLENLRVSIRFARRFNIPNDLAYIYLYGAEKPIYYNGIENFPKDAEFIRYANAYAAIFKYKNIVLGSKGVCEAHAFYIMSFIKKFSKSENSKYDFKYVALSKQHITGEKRGVYNFQYSHRAVQVIDKSNNKIVAIFDPFWTKFGVWDSPTIFTENSWRKFIRSRWAWEIVYTDFEHDFAQKEYGNLKPKATNSDYIRFLFDKYDPSLIPFMLKDKHVPYCDNEDK